jgi:hypothetical protein
MSLYWARVSPPSAMRVFTRRRENFIARPISWGAKHDNLAFFSLAASNRNRSDFCMCIEQYRHQRQRERRVRHGRLQRRKRPWKYEYRRVCDGRLGYWWRDGERRLAIGWPRRRRCAKRRRCGIRWQRRRRWRRFRGRWWRDRLRHDHVRFGRDLHHGALRGVLRSTAVVYPYPKRVHRRPQLRLLHHGSVRRLHDVPGGHGRRDRLW